MAKKEPGKYSAGTPPAPTVNYFGAMLFNALAGVELTIVTYKGTGPLTTDLLGGHVPLGFDTIPASVSNIQAKQLNGIAVASTTRSPALPNVPTAAESGLPGYEAVQYYGLAAPAGTPRPIIEKLNAVLRGILAIRRNEAAPPARGQRAGDRHAGRLRRQHGARGRQVGGADQEARIEVRVSVIPA
jgi:tripartite-type tricarboxylate transporter receptor subunit TctC